MKIRLLFSLLSGRRLDSIVYKKERNQSVTGCQNLCFQDDCCRSVNYNKSSSDDNKENCELLNVVEGEQHGHLKYDPHYDHYDLLGPPKVRKILKISSLSPPWSLSYNICVCERVFLVSESKPYRVSRNTAQPRLGTESATSVFLERRSTDWATWSSRERLRCEECL